MKGKSNQSFQELMSFKHMALWLLAYKLYRDYLEIIKFGQQAEPESFFEAWDKSYAPSIYSKEEKNCVWSLFLKLLIARTEYNV